MLILALTTDKLSVITDTAATLDVHVDFSINTSGTITFSKQNAAISSAATTDILDVPASSTVRNANTINIRNKDATLACGVIVQYNANGTLYQLKAATLQPGNELTYTEGVGWFLYAASPALDMVKYVTANSVHATAATFADITGLTYPVVSGRVYSFQAMLAAITDATTTGAQFGIGGVAMTFMVAAGYSTLLGSPTGSATITSGVVTAINTAVMAQTTGAAVNQPHIFWGSFQPSASGTFAIRATSEVTTANALTVLKGSYARVTLAANG